MTPTAQLTEILSDLQNVLKVIQNDPEHIIPEKHHVRLKAAIYDSLIAISMTKKQMEDFEIEKDKTREQLIEEKGYAPNDLTTEQEQEITTILQEITDKRKALFDAGLSTPAQMDFKFAMCKHIYEELSVYMNIQNDGKDYKSELHEQYNEFYEGVLPNGIDAEVSEPQPAANSWRKNVLGKIETFLPKLKTYLSAKKTLISSLAKVYNIQEKVSEVLGFIDVGITMTQPILKAINKKD